MPENFAQILSRQKRATGGRSPGNVPVPSTASTVTAPGVLSPQQSAVSTGMIPRIAASGPSGTESSVIGRLENKAQRINLDQFEADQEAQRRKYQNQLISSQDDFDTRMKKSQDAFSLESQDLASRLAQLKLENAETAGAAQTRYDNQLSAIEDENQVRMTESEALRASEKARIDALINGQIIRTIPTPVPSTYEPTWEERVAINKANYDKEYAERALENARAAEVAYAERVKAAQEAAAVKAEAEAKRIAELKKKQQIEGPGAGEGGLGIGGPGVYGGGLFGGQGHSLG